jgi:RNA polymerase sigma-70 factor (ECF subfamily)
MTAQREDHEQALERFRTYLSFLARVQIDPRLQGEIDLSGVVQQTLLEAHQRWERICSTEPEVQARQLRCMLANNLRDEIRKIRTQGRDVHRKRSLEAALEQSSARLENVLRAEESTPSQKAERQEEALRVAEALAKLPEAEREALYLQHWHGWTLDQIGKHLHRTPGSVAGLLHRGMERLKGYLQPTE